MGDPPAQDIIGCREVIEAKLRLNVEAARQAYENAKEKFRQAVALQSDLGTHNPDGRRAFLAAAAEQRRAIGVYAAALQKFHAFLIQHHSAELPDPT